MAQFEDTFEGGKAAAFQEMLEFASRRSLRDPTNFREAILARLQEKCGGEAYGSPVRLAEADAADGYKPGDHIPGTPEDEPGGEATDFEGVWF